MQTLWRDFVTLFACNLPGSPRLPFLHLPGYRRKHRHFSIAGRVRLRASGKDQEQIAKISIDHRNGASSSFTSRYDTYAQWNKSANGSRDSQAFCLGANLFNISPSGEVPMSGLCKWRIFQTLGVNLF